MLNLYEFACQTNKFTRSYESRNRVFVERSSGHSVSLASHSARQFEIDLIHATHTSNANQTLVRSLHRKRAVISDYCNASSAPTSSNTRSGTGKSASLGQTISFECALGYVGDTVYGQPSHTCSAGTAAAGNWSVNNGSCVGAWSQVKHKIKLYRKNIYNFLIGFVRNTVQYL